MSATIQLCLNCQSRLFPLRLLCPACGGARLNLILVESGVIEQATTSPDGTVLATVRPDGGPALIARLTGQAFPGDTVTLTNDPGAEPGYAYIPFAPSTHDPSLEEQ